MAELKPCPFCGGKDFQVINVYGEDFYVDCQTCTTCGPSGETEGEAIEAWNRRYDPVSGIDFDYEAEDD